MAASAQALYLHLVMNADDEGVVEAFPIMRLAAASEDDLKELAEHKFIRILNDDFVAHILDWDENNKIRPDRKRESLYKDLLEEDKTEEETNFTTDEKPSNDATAADCGQVSADCPTSDGQLSADCGQVSADCPHRLGKDRLGKDRIKDNNAHTRVHAREDPDPGKVAGETTEAKEEVPLSQREPPLEAEGELSPKETDLPARRSRTISATTETDRIRERFTEFWATYPKKQGKGAAEKAFLKISPTASLHETMIAAIRAAVLSRQWREQNGRFIPNPATWLNQRRWEDTLPVETVNCPQVEAADRVIAMLESREEAP